MGLFIYQRVSSIKLFDIHSLESEALTGLFEEVSSYVQNIRIEMVSYPRRSYETENNPAILIGVRQNKTAIRFNDSLDRRQRVEAIAHELAHLLLIYRYGLSLIDHRSLYPGDASEVSEDAMGRERNWFFFLGQMTNTLHHLILVPYLKEVYGIGSELQLRLLKRSCIPFINLNDQEPQLIGGLIAYEYERLIGERNPWIKLYGQSGDFQKALEAARRRFQETGYPSIPSSSHYKENISSFLEDLGYPGEEFLFFPQGMDHSCSDVDKKKQREDFLST
jgi:hypothetical protein